METELEKARLYLTLAQEANRQNWQEASCRHLTSAFHHLLEALEAQSTGTSSAPTTGLVIGPCPSCGASLAAIRMQSAWKSSVAARCDLWACGKCGTEVLTPKKTPDKPTLSGSSGSEASAETPGPIVREGWVMEERDDTGLFFPSSAPPSPSSAPSEETR